MTRLALLALCACLASTPALADAAADMAAAVNGFYGVYARQKRIGGLPGAAARAAYAPYLSARLAGQLNNAAAAEAAYTKKFKAVPPLFEGDLFTSLFEGATAWNVGTCGGDARTGACAVSFTYAAAGTRPQTWTDRVLLVNGGAGWKIDDVSYEAGFQFGNSGRLSQTIAMVLAQAGR